MPSTIRAMIKIFRDGGWAVPLGSRFGATDYTSLNCENPNLIAWLKTLETFRQALCSLVGVRCDSHFVHENCEQVNKNAFRVSVARNSLQLQQKQMETKFREDWLWTCSSEYNAAVDTAGHRGHHSCFWDVGTCLASHSRFESGRVLLHVRLVHEN